MSEIRAEPGTVVALSDKLDARFEIISWLSLDKLEVRNLENGTIITVNASKLGALNKQKKHSAPSFEMLTDKQKALAKKRYDIIRPLLDKNSNDLQKTIVEKLVAEYAISKRTLHTWLQRFNDSGKISSLADKRNSRGSRKFQLNKQQLAVIEKVAREHYETPQKLRVQRTIERVRMECQSLKIRLPSESTIRRHIAMRNPLKAAELREGRKTAHDRYGAIYGKFPGAEYPLAVVQMDHTRLNIELVDDEERLPIGRPNITLAIDVFSRAILGFFVSFENSSLLTTGLCLEHVMFPKDEWLDTSSTSIIAGHFGASQTCLHVDNALEFRSNGLKDFCDEYDVRLEYRPVKTPHYGGHVERVFRTIAEQIHTLPGTTFSNIKQKGEYASAKKAVVTLSAFQKWLGEYITGVYLKKIHSGIAMTPLDKWTQGIRGTKEQPGVGVPPIIAEREDACTLLLPTYERSIQRDGIRLDHIQYFSPALHVLFIEALTQKKYLKVKIKRDPRDISSIKVLDEFRKEWLVVPYRDIRHPSISLWKWQAAQVELKKSRTPNSETTLFNTYRRMEEIVEQEKSNTRSARRKRQRSADAKKTKTPLRIVGNANNENELAGDNFVPIEQVYLSKKNFDHE